MNNIETLGFNNWFWESIPSGKDKIDLYKTVNFKIALSELKYEILFLQQFYANQINK